jgi:hypothetical protein
VRSFQRLCLNSGVKRKGRTEIILGKEFMIPAIYILLALLSLAASIFFFGNACGSCGIGHSPPIISFGNWTVPLSLLGAPVFLYLSIFLWNSRHLNKAGQLRREARLLPKKFIIFLASLIVTIIAWFLLMIVVVALAIGTEGRIEGWISYFLYPLFAFVAIYFGVVVYRKLGRFVSNM